MKKLILEKVTGWLGYTRRERRASLVLIMLIVLVYLFRYAVPGRSEGIDIKQFATDDRPVNVSGHAEGQFSGAPSEPVVRRAPVNAPIELNTCDSALLVTLPGIGPVLAGRIIRFRGLLGGFAEVGQLSEVYGLPATTFDLIRGRITVNPDLIRRIDINSAGYRQLTRLPYLSGDQVSAILKHRETAGMITGFEELKAKGIVSEDDVRRIKPYIEFR